MLAQAYSESDRHYQAVAQYSEAVKLRPHEPGLHYELENEYEQMTNLEAAQNSYQEELVIDPTNASAQYQVGSLEAERHEVGEGLLRLKQSLQFNPKLTDAYYYIGLGDLRTDQYQLRLMPKPIHSSSPITGFGSPVVRSALQPDLRHPRPS